jgi:hypothetical protein
VLGPAAVGILAALADHRIIHALTRAASANRAMLSEHTLRIAEAEIDRGFVLHGHIRQRELRKSEQNESKDFHNDLLLWI